MHRAPHSGSSQAWPSGERRGAGSLPRSAPEAVPPDGSLPRGCVCRGVYVYICIRCVCVCNVRAFGENQPSHRRVRRGRAADRD